MSRATFYRWGACRMVRAEEIKLRDSIQKIALQNSGYGYRRITQELQRRKHVINHKRVLRLMRQDNLLCLRKRPWWRLPANEIRYPNLMRDIKLTGIDQAWVADITYIRLRWEFIYLAVILDAFSRRCIAWQVHRNYDAELAILALKKALIKRRFKPGLIHHSDQGPQYSCNEYIGLLNANAIRISMSRSGNPYDNAKAESFIKTLKYEEVLLNEYRDLQEARQNIGHFIENVYNRKRLHSALGYLPPVEFEAKTAGKE